MAATGALNSAGSYVTRGTSILRYGLFHKCRQNLVYSARRCFATPTNTEQDEFKFETLTGDFEGKIIRLTRSIEYICVAVSIYVWHFCPDPRPLKQV